MSKKLRGSYYVDGRRSLTHTTSEDDKLMDVGFRLVHDSEERVNRGECWFDRAGTAHSALGIRNHPSEKYSNTGLRLCVDWNQK